MTEGKEEIKQAETEYELADFLESHPPNQVVRISNLAKSEIVRKVGKRLDLFLAPQIQLHCSNESCNGRRFFQSFLILESGLVWSNAPIKRLSRALVCYVILYTSIRPNLNNLSKVVISKL